MKTKKIVIKSTSGFCPVDYAYNDKLTITANSIAYEYKPYLESDNSLNVCRKWSYKTTNSIFSLAFEKIAMAVVVLLRDHDIVSVCYAFNFFLLSFVSKISISLHTSWTYHQGAC